MKKTLRTLLFIVLFATTAYAVNRNLRVLEIDYTTAPTNLQIPVFTTSDNEWNPAGVSTVLDDDLDAIAALAGTDGLLAKTAANTWALRGLVEPAAGLDITNPRGIAGDPTFALADDLAGLEGMSGTGLVARTGSGTYAQRTLQSASAGLTWTNGDGVSGNPVPVLADDLAGLEGMSGTGLVARTGSGTYAQRTLQSASAGLTWTNGDGVSGNPVPVLADDLSGLEGLSGTGIAKRTGTSTWSTISDGTANQVLGMNSGATAQEYKSFAVGTSGTDFAVAHSANTVTFNLPDASASNRGAVTTGTQTLAGAKTFSGGITVSAAGINSAFDLYFTPNPEYGIRYTKSDITAAGSSQGTATAITGRLTFVDGSDGTKGVILPASPGAGQVYILYNYPNAILKLYPGSGDAINQLGANNAASIAAQSMVYCWAYSASAWMCGEMPGV